MLEDFQRLNGTFSIKTEKDLPALLNDAEVETLQSFQYDPATWPVKCKRVEAKRFKNVGLSKTLFEEITFKECTFEDCLFIGTIFRGVEFHRCKFKNCNFYKAQFARCYIDPNSFEFYKYYKAKYANIGVGLFQSLLENSAEMRQTTFQIRADTRFRQWERSQLSYDRRTGKIDKIEEFFQRFGNYAYEWTSGYGYKPFRFFFFTLLMFLLIALGNYVFLRDQIAVGSDGRTLSSFEDSIFYSFSILTVLGFSSITPASGLAKIIAVTEALASIGWLGVYTSLLVKKFIR